MVIHTEDKSTFNHQVSLGVSLLSFFLSFFPLSLLSSPHPLIPSSPHPLFPSSPHPLIPSLSLSLLQKKTMAHLHTDIYRYRYRYRWRRCIIHHTLPADKTLEGVSPDIPHDIPLDLDTNLWVAPRGIPLNLEAPHGIPVGTNLEAPRGIPYDVPSDLEAPLGISHSVPSDLGVPGDPRYLSRHPYPV